jgi:hypothetical protein
MWVGIRPEKIELLKREEGAAPPHMIVSSLHLIYIPK